MVTWSDDINLERICDGINKYISNYKMKDYYIFGLQQGDRPHVRITPECPQSLRDLFLKSGYALEVRNNNERYCGECDTHHTLGDCHCGGDNTCPYCNPEVISIGIRRDIRGDVDACRKLIKTIMFAIEGKLVLDKNSKLNLGRRVSRDAPKPSEPKEEKKELELPDGVLAALSDLRLDANTTTVSRALIENDYIPGITEEEIS